MEPVQKKLSKEEALRKAGHFCAYQERCHVEVIQRLNEWGVYGHAADEILSVLVEKNYVNEERFATIYAGSKFRVKHWGRHKIVAELKAKKIAEYCIRKGLQAIEDEQYMLVLNEEASRKMVSLKKGNPFEKKQQTAKYLISRGFESDLVWDVLNRVA